MNKFFTRESIHQTDRAIDDQLRDEIHALAEAAYHRHLISGHGDSEYPDAYQIVHQGKPMHLPLNDARTFLATLMQRS